MIRRDLLPHKKDNIVEHTEMNLNQMRVEIKQLKHENTEMKWKIKSMKELDGVEWEIRNIDKLTIGGEIEGPTFYVSNYKLGICCIIGSQYWKNIYFYLKRIGGDFDKNLGLSYLTHYRVIRVNKRNYNESEYTKGRMNYQLKIGTKSREIEWYRNNRIYRYIQTQDQSLLLRFYFEVNSNPLESLDAEYFNKTPPVITESPLGNDPWDYLYYSDSD